MEVAVESPLNTPFLDQRFSALKQRLVRPENKQNVIESYDKLVKLLEAETALIEKNGPNMVPEIDFEDVRKNGGVLPDAFADIVRDRGCLILRNVVPEQQAVAWEASLKDYIHCHPGIGGFPQQKPVGWNIYWTKAQVEMRSHPEVLKALRCVSRLWHVADPSAAIDLDSQIVYPDRIRIRYPSDDPRQFPLAPHLDSGAIERWEDETNRMNFKAIFEGNWQNWDPWLVDHRIHAKSNLYTDLNTGEISCSAWRSLQGWLSLSHTNTGEGTLRMMPSIKLSTAYIMLRPLFHTGEYNDSLPTFPGATPGKTQFFPTTEHHPHLSLDRAIVGIPPVRPGDYVFWHCDLVHGVDATNTGKNDSSVFYNACNPLTPYNIESLIHTREEFLKAAVPTDFVQSQKPTWEKESQHEDCGAKRENILSEEGERTLGLRRFDDDEPGLIEGQREVRRLANSRLGL